MRRTAGTRGAASEIEKAGKLLHSRAINQAEFKAIKAKALASWDERVSLTPGRREWSSGIDLLLVGEQGGHGKGRLPITTPMTNFAARTPTRSRGTGLPEDPSAECR